jgi:hypothetical protein
MISCWRRCLKTFAACAAIDVDLPSRTLASGQNLPKCLAIHARWQEYCRWVYGVAEQHERRQQHGPGYAALQNSDTSYNTAIGYGALNGSTGNINTALGYQSGTNVTSGTNNIDIGIRARPATVARFASAPPAATPPSSRQASQLL